MALSPRTDPACPRCDTALYTEPKRGRAATSWVCHWCGIEFEP